MGSTGATLSGSYSGATSSPTAIGFKYGTSQGSMTQTLNATENNGSFSAILSGLSASTTYYYKAFVTVKGTGDYSGHSETFYGNVYSFTTGATSTVTTGSASNTTSSSATLSASYANVVTGNYAPQTVYFKYGTSSGNLNQTAYYNSGINSASGSFSVNVEGLSTNTTYYYKACMMAWNGSAYVEISGSIQNFTTEQQVQLNTNYLTDYGMPDVSSLNPTFSKSGSVSARDDIWYRYTTNNSQRQIAVHTYSSGAPNNAETMNYVVLYDESKYAPVWTVHTMNSTYWQDKNVGRNEDWTDDPAISLTQQSGLNNAGTVGYSKGHLVASNYRQTTVKQNMQTFYHSNQAPQWQNSFNSGVWSSMEEAIAAHIPSGNTMLYVTIGVLYEGNVTTKPSESLNVPIPSHFYTCLMKCELNGSGEVTSAQGIAYIFTNEAHSGHYYDSAYVTTIDAIEARAGFDFFAAVPTNLQNAAESVATPLW